MNWIAVASSTLVKVGYEACQKLLLVEFHNGVVYQYSGVPSELHQELLAAPSKGRFFNEAIRGRFAFARLAGLAETDDRLERQS